MITKDIAGYIKKIEDGCVWFFAAILLRLFYYVFFGAELNEAYREKEKNEELRHKVPNITRYIIYTLDSAGDYGMYFPQKFMNLLLDIESILETSFTNDESADLYMSYVYERRWASRFLDVLHSHSKVDRDDARWDRVVERVKQEGKRV